MSKAEWPLRRAHMGARRQQERIFLLIISLTRTLMERLIVEFSALRARTPATGAQYPISTFASRQTNAASNTPQSARAFTLLEMLIALAIIAVVGLTLSSAVGSVAAQTYRLEQRMVAHWIAENQLTRVQLASIGETNKVPTGADSGQVRMAGRVWRVHREVQDTTHPWLRRVEIEVYQVSDGEDVGPLDRTVGFIGIH